LKKSRPNLTAGQAQYYLQTIFPPLAKMTLLVTPDQHAVAKNFVRIKFGPSPPQVSEPQMIPGRWQRAGDAYRLTLDDRGRTETLEAVVELDRLTLSGESIP